MTTEIGGLSHLVEAATALANLDSTGGQHDVIRAPQVNTLLSSNSCEKGIENAGGTCGEGEGSIKSKRETFPQKLHSVLNNSSLSDVISWLPHGRSFVIIRPDVFSEKVMPIHLPPCDARGSTKYSSFTRKLNRWGFRQATRGSDTGAFHHPLFQRDDPYMCVGMVCQRSRTQTPKSSANKKTVKEGSLQVAPLTKESIEKILPTPQTTLPTATATVSLDETRSENSHNSFASVGASVSAPSLKFNRGISNNKEFVEMTIRQRDETERMRVAQALLYRAFIDALQNESK